MKPDPAAEARLLGKLALRGVLPRTAVAALFEEARAAREAGQDVSLASLAVKRGLIDKDRLLRYFHTDGDDPPDLPGYSYVAKLGEGGMADVYRVRRSEGATEAVKILKEHLAGDAATVKAFVSEADLLKRLKHPNVVKGYRVGRLQGRYLFFMEDVDGPTLLDKIREGAFDEDGALFVILQVARALDYLRSEGIVHRDIKPGNILIAAGNTVKVIDLGFAAAGGQAAGGASGSGTTKGTAAYLSPEQAMGRDDLDIRSDIYSLGATLYQIVLGELPFTGDDQELVQKAVLEGLSAQATKGGRISVHMHYFIEKMMAKDRDIRYQDPHELMADIEAQISGKKTLEAEEQAGPADEDVERKRRRIERMRKRRQRR